MTKRKHAEPYDGPTLRGVDVSHHNRDDVLDGLEDEIDFLFIRYADGITEDRKWQEWVTWAIDHDKPWDFYVYVRAYHGAVKNAMPMLVAREEYGGCMFPVFDVEDTNRGAWWQPGTDEWMNTVEVAAEVYDIEALMHNHAGGAIAYAGQAVHWRLMQAGLWAAQSSTVLWTPSPGTETPLVPVHDDGSSMGLDGEWTFWQDTVRFDGRHLDGNLFRGDRQRFYELFGYEPYNQHRDAVVPPEQPTAVTDLRERVSALELGLARLELEVRGKLW